MCTWEIHACNFDCQSQSNIRKSYLVLVTPSRPRDINKQTHTHKLNPQFPIPKSMLLLQVFDKELHSLWSMYYALYIISAWLNVKWQIIIIFPHTQHTHLRKSEPIIKFLKLYWDCHVRLSDQNIGWRFFLIPVISWTL